jgi:hypothetical protein
VNAGDHRAVPKIASWRIDAWRCRDFDWLNLLMIGAGSTRSEAALLTNENGAAGAHLPRHSQ